MYLGSCKFPKPNCPIQTNGISWERCPNSTSKNSMHTIACLTVRLHPLCKFTWGPLLCAMVSGNARRYATAIPACLQLPRFGSWTTFKLQTSCHPYYTCETDSMDTICSLIIFVDPREVIQNIYIPIQLSEWMHAIIWFNSDWTVETLVVKSHQFHAGLMGQHTQHWQVHD